MALTRAEVSWTPGSVRSWAGAWLAHFADGRLRRARAIILRGAACFIGLFALVGLIGELRGRATATELWFVDIRDLAPALRAGLVGAFGVAVLAWSLVPCPARRVRLAAAVLAASFSLLALRDTLSFARASTAREFHPGVPIPLSALVAATLALIALQALLGNTPRDVGARAVATLGATVVGWACIFVLAQMLFFGASDYRRPAAVAVVFGAGVDVGGQPTSLLANRIETAVRLYRSEFVPLLLMSGGNGATGYNEASVMRDVAERDGVPASAIMVDGHGVSTEATVTDARSILADRSGSLPAGLIAVSQAYHLPRVQLAFDAAGVDVLTVPAADAEGVDVMAPLIAREIPAFWAYYLRICLGP